MKRQRVLLLGGTGFVGTAVAGELARLGLEFTVPTRQLSRANHLLPLPTITVVRADIHDAHQLATLMVGHDAVINLVGILHGNFERDHVTLPKLVAEACVKSGVRRLVHMSALNADVNGPSEYLRSRGRGAAAVQGVANKGAALDVTIFRPSVIFGEQDKFLNMFAGLIQFSPFIPLGSADAKFQPVWVQDVARAFVQSLDVEQTFGKCYDLVGPHVYSLRQLIEFVMSTTGQRRPIFGMGSSLSMLQATAFEFLPGKLITRDNVHSMSLPSTSEQSFPSLFGEAHSMETVVPDYMTANNGRGRYNRFRHEAGR
jgi:NADH dehydrogenase